jgi:nitrite reductase (NADH) small subunit
MNVLEIGTEWIAACRTEDVPEDGGVCALIKGEQVAIFNFTRLGKWFATQNECPHRQQMAISRGMIGTMGDVPKVACPFHKKTFSLETGDCLNDDNCGHLKTYPIQVEDGQIFVRA